MAVGLVVFDLFHFIFNVFDERKIKYIVFSNLIFEIQYSSCKLEILFIYVCKQIQVKLLWLLK